MEKQEVIVDTCFLEKIAAYGKYPENIKRVLDDLAYKPVVHQYVAEQELSLISYLNDLLKEGYIRSIQYNEFISDKTDKTIYENHFEKIYNEMRYYLKTKRGRKQMPELIIPQGETIYSAHISGSSIGDVHMIIMALYLRLPIFLSEDSDIEVLRDLAKRRLSSSSYQLEIYGVLDIMKKVAGKPDTTYSHKELERIVKQIGEKKSWSCINNIWHKFHD